MILCSSKMAEVTLQEILVFCFVAILLACHVGSTGVLQQVSQGSEIVLTPSLSATWWKFVDGGDDELVDVDSNRIKVDKYGRLWLSNFTASDSGLYKLKIYELSSDTEWKSIELDTFQCCGAAKPYTTHIQPGENLILECDLTSRPSDPIKWTRGDVRGHKLRTGSVYAITSVDISHSGTYVCSTVSVAQYFHVFVKEPENHGNIIGEGTMDKRVYSASCEEECNRYVTAFYIVLVLLILFVVGFAILLVVCLHQRKQLRNKAHGQENASVNPQTTYSKGNDISNPSEAVRLLTNEPKDEVDRGINRSTCEASGVEAEMKVTKTEKIEPCHSCEMKDQENARLKANHADELEHNQNILKLTETENERLKKMDNDRLKEIDQQNEKISKMKKKHEEEVNHQDQVISELREKLEEQPKDEVDRGINRSTCEISGVETEKIARMTTNHADEMEHSQNILKLSETENERLKKLYDDRLKEIDQQNEQIGKMKKKHEEEVNQKDQVISELRQKLEEQATNFEKKQQEGRRINRELFEDCIKEREALQKLWRSVPGKHFEERDILASDTPKKFKDNDSDDNEDRASGMEVHVHDGYIKRPPQNEPKESESEKRLMRPGKPVTVFDRSAAASHAPSGTHAPPAPASHAPSGGPAPQAAAPHAQSKAHIPPVQQGGPSEATAHGSVTAQILAPSEQNNALLRNQPKKELTSSTTGKNGRLSTSVQEQNTFTSTPSNSADVPNPVITDTSAESPTIPSMESQSPNDI